MATSKPSVEEIMEALKHDEKARTAVIKFLARDFSRDFLVPVRINADKMKSAGGVGSDKEWQE